MPTATTDKARPVADARWTPLWWWSRDGVRLHARDHAAEGDTGAVHIVLLPGPVTTARAFEATAPRFAGAGHRALAVDLRGRGDSGYAPDALSYAPLTYAQDVAALLDEAAVARAVILGSSLSGAAALILAAQRPERVAGLVLVDHGPAPDRTALARMAALMGPQAPQPTWMHAARAIEAQCGDAHPAHRIQDWLRVARQMRRLTPEGRIVADHDPAIAVPWRGVADGGTLPAALTGDGWALFDLVAARGLPMLMVRGALSEFVTPAVLARLAAGAPRLEVVTVPAVGHAPSLEEDGVVDAVIGFAATCR